MITKIQINKQTLEVNADVCNCLINHIKDENGIIELEISIPEPESFYPYFRIES